MSEQNERPSRRSRTARLPDEDPGAGRAEGRHTERLAGGDEWSAREPVNPGWRNERSSTRPARRRGGALPASPQEFQLWLQAGGWLYAVGIALLLVVLLIAVLAFSRGDERDAGLGLGATAAPTLGSVGVGSDPLIQPTTTLPPEPTAAPSAQFFVVAGTGAEGLFLRPNPSREGEPLSTLPEGSRVEQIGPDFTGPDRLWRNVRAPDGREGWVAADFLQPAP